MAKTAPSLAAHADQTARDARDAGRLGPVARRPRSFTRPRLADALISGIDADADLDDVADEPLEPNATRHRLMTADAAAAVFGVALGLSFLLAFRPMADSTLSRHLLLTVASFPVFALGSRWCHLDRARANERRASELMNIVKTSIIGTSGLVVLAFLAQMKDLSRLWVFTVAASFALALTIERSIARNVFARLRTSGRMRRRIVIVGTDSHAVRLFQQFENDPSLGYEVVGFVGASDRNFLFRDRVLGSYDDLDEALVRTSAIGVVVSPACVRERDLNSMTRRLTDDGYHVVISASLQDIDVSRLRPQSIDGRSVLYVEPVARSGAPLVAKRVFDIAVATTLLVVSSPILLISAIAIKATSRGPALFRQTRVGRNGVTFTMMKLRTMVADAEAQLDDLADQNEADGPLFKMECDPRVTRVGRFLRRSSIDELPQLIAVLRGTMSMVGPRPALPDEVANWDAGTRERLRVLPGLTGLWQVSGRSDASFDTYKRLDLYYVHNWSLRHDLSICVRTIGVVLRARGAR